MNLKISKTNKLATSAIVIALYVVIMIVTQSFAFGSVQIRVATCLYAFAYLFPFLVLPLGLSNLLSNMMLGGFGFFDIVGGGFVGILTAFLVYCVRKFNLNIFLIAIPIILIPGLIVPIWLSALLNIPYVALATSLCVGQIIPGILGAYLVKILQPKIGA